MPYRQSHTGSHHYAALSLAVLCLLAGQPSRPLLAQGATQPLWTRDSLRSSILGEQRFLRISLPAFYNAPWNSPERFPVLIVLDAEGDLPFTALAATVRTLAEGTSTPAMPPLIVVGVETPNPARFRDMTPPPVGAFVPSAGFPAPGGAPAFLRFLSEELRPYITARYRTQPTTILAGHSLSGSFAAWAFGHAPEFLVGVIATSPTPGWLTVDSLAGRQVVDGIATRTTPGRLFIANGTAEQYLGGGVQSFATLVRARSVSGLEFQYEQIPDAAHELARSLGMTPGLRFLFRPVSLSGFQLEFEDGEDALSKFSAIYDSTRTAYLLGARQLGLLQRLPLNFLSLRARQLGWPALAPLQLRLCQEITTWYPTLWNGFDCAGDALARIGRAGEATASYRRGSEAARIAGDSATAERLRRKAEPRPDAPHAPRDDHALLRATNGSILGNRFISKRHAIIGTRAR